MQSAMHRCCTMSCVRPRLFRPSAWSSSAAMGPRQWKDGGIVATQERQLGTGHAVLAARDALDGFDGDLFVLFGDTPFLKPETLARMQAARAQADIVALGFRAADPGHYGRLVTSADGMLEAIVEARDAGPEELARSEERRVGQECRSQGEWRRDRE